MKITVGLDVGGAHLKVALIEPSRAWEVRQIACPLWQGLDTLDAALAKARPLIDRAEQAAVTMTGELSDLFPDRQTGVATLVARLSRELGDGARFWMGRRGFGAAEEAKQHPGDVGSTNFLATGALIGRHLDEALLIDFGSTTADIIPVIGGMPAPRGFTDAERQITGELVYTGFTRTAVMGVASRAPWSGTWVSLAREYLATMADVRRILGEDLTDIDQHATADGKGKSVAESVTRLARMLGRDAADGDASDWHRVAEWLREAQLQSLIEGAFQVLSARPLSNDGPVVVAGIGARDAALVAHRLGRHSIAFGELAGASGEAARAATQAAPAVAVALLIAAQQG
ncbi:MAG: hydantoinase/oxoprolinase family protein [Hyphomicrobium sp.]|uniref:hydantoinase/oxoprolinase family protein n=1 Tax=Hyphomicrobium sp. TaxID=82 RepID=UPI003D14446B